MDRVLLAIVMGLLAIASLVAFVVPLRIAMRHEDGPRTVGSGVAPGTTEFVGLSHLEVGVELKFDRQTWFVRGVQHVTAPDGTTWSAWHLDDRGQGGWMATDGADEDIVFAVRAESPETIDPALAAVTWRKHEWERTTVDGGTVRAEGERRLARRGDMAPVSATDVERVVFARPDLPARRLVLERSAGEETWNAWIGTAVPGSMIDVWPPAGALAAPASASPTPEPGVDPSRDPAPRSQPS